MIVYRLEHYSEPSPTSNNINKGPYRLSLDIGYRACGGTYITSDITHPEPDKDPLLATWWNNLTNDEAKSWVFVFASLEQLHRWFFDIVAMQEFDKEQLARIGVYQVPNEAYKAGQFQSVALSSEMNIVDVYKCSYKP